MLEVRQLRWAAWAVAAIALVVAGNRLVAALSGGAGEVVAPVQVEPAPAGDGAAGAGAPEGGPAGAGGGASAGASAAVHVHVAGAVRRPGLYELPAGARIADAVERAGGPARRAQLDGVNLAARLRDGEQVLVPRRGAGGGTVAAAPVSGPLDLNAATLEQLDALQGVGPATAQAILDYRDEHGGFRSVDELDAVPGIGPGRLATLRAAVTV